MIIDRSQLAAALPGYELRDQLGVGHFGLVLAGRHRGLERDVAIKVLAVADEGADDRFSAEARLLARMDHSHIVRVYEAYAKPL
jgi:eukaryotic-like serine/threonine-protein kinase